MILFILAAIFAYQKAKSNGRNGILWAFIAAGVYIGAQVVLALGIGIFLGLGTAFFGWSETNYDDWSLLVSAICILGSFGSVWLVFRYLDKLPEDGNFGAPPPPPTFSGR